jgi:hypothetical protein
LLRIRPEAKVTAADAKDLLDFTHAICEYVYVLTKKYADFRKRQEAKAARLPGTPPVGPASPSMNT